MWSSLSDLKKIYFKKSGGQTTVEFILLLAVVMIMILTVFKGTRFMEMFVDPGEFFIRYKKVIEFTYRNGYMETQPFLRGYNVLDDDIVSNQFHHSYFNQAEQDTRFFLVIETYP